jgi:thiol-disulfide isomerase/thioredoxin
VSTGQKVKALTIGDKAPDIIISNVYNSSVSKMHLSDLKGKLVILDFMATTCVPCIKVLPRFDSLQQQYGGHLQIILVSAERSERIQGFLKKKKSLKLPFAADSNASRYFPHTFISHVAWINAEGVVCAITHTEYVNSKNIQTVLNGQKVNWPVKRDIPEYDYRKHLLKFNESIIPNEALPAHYYYTAIVSYLPGVQKHNKVIEDSVNNLTHISLINFSVLELYKILFRRFQIPLSHILLDEKTKEQLIYNPASEYFEMWKRDHVHCLEATLPIHLSASQQRAKLIQDVGFYFGLKALVEKRSVECIVLKNKQVPRKKTTATNGLTLASVVGTLNNQLNAIPVIDETRGTVYLRLPLTENEVKLNSSLRKILNDFGIELSTEKRTIEFLLINQTHQTPTY